VTSTCLPFLLRSVKLHNFVTSLSAISALVSQVSHEVSRTIVTSLSVISALASQVSHEVPRTIVTGILDLEAPPHIFDGGVGFTAGQQAAQVDCLARVFHSLHLSTSDTSDTRILDAVNCAPNICLKGSLPDSMPHRWIAWLVFSTRCT
jgi:hypothetical protein